jgi:hypothetical protein
MTDLNAEAELQRTSEEFLRSLDEVARLEERKTALDPDDPRRQALAREVEERTLALLARSQQQTDLVEAAAPDVLTPPRRPHLVLADWRAAERRVHEALLAAKRASLESAAFLEEYRRSVELVNADDTHGD